MVNLRAILSSYFVTLPVLGTDIVSVAEGPGCSGAVLQIPSTIGCTKMGGLGASTLEVLGTRSTENQDPADIVLFVYTGESCDGSHAQLDPGICYDIQDFQSAKVVYLPDEESAFNGASRILPGKLRGHEYQKALTPYHSSARESRHRQINGQPRIQRLGEAVQITNAANYLVPDSRSNMRINSIQNDVVHLINIERKRNGCPGLASSSNLVNAVQAHSQDMASRGYFDHTTPEGVTFGDRLHNAGYQFGLAAENIAMGQASPTEAVDAWMNSEGNRANILNCNLKQTGVGAAQSSDGSWYWTQDFVSPP